MTDVQNICLKYSLTDNFIELVEGGGKFPFALGPGYKQTKSHIIISSRVRTARNI
jgi:hypothetical protein